MTRRALLALAPLLVAACAAPAPVAPAPPASPQLPVPSAVDLLPAAGLVWVVDLRLRELLGSPDLIAALAALFPEERFAAFARRHGGIDLRQTLELALAGYDGATVAVARAPLDPARVEGAFAARALAVEGRAVDGPIVRTWGTVGQEREQLAILGREAAALEVGRFGPLRAVEAFARGRLHRSLPALRPEPLATAVKELGDAYARAFAPGPFEGAWAAGLGGVLGAATAAGAAARVDEGDPAAIALALVLTGAWGADAPAAAERVRAAFDLLASDALGRLLGLDRPRRPLRATGGAGALRLEGSFDAVALARGLHAVTERSVAEALAL